MVDTYKHPDKDVFINVVCRCGSRSVEQFAKTENYTLLSQFNLNLPKNSTIYCITRKPSERFYSGIIQLINEESWRNKHNNTNEFNLFNQHTLNSATFLFESMNSYIFTNHNHTLYNVNILQLNTLFSFLSNKKQNIIENRVSESRICKEILSYIDFYTLNEDIKTYLDYENKIYNQILNTFIPFTPK